MIADRFYREPVPPPATTRDDTVKAEFEAIMLAWDRACRPAKRRAFAFISDMMAANKVLGND